MGRHKTYDRDTVLDGAMALFWRKGFEGASLAELVAATGLNRFSLYKEFDGKEKLFEASLERFLGYRLEEYTATLDRTPFGLPNIRAYFTGLTQEDDLGCFMFNTLTQRGAVPEAAYRMARAAMAKAETLFLTNVRAASRVGELRAGVAAVTTAKFLLTLDQGLHSFGMADATIADKNRIVGLALEGLGGAEPKQGRLAASRP